MGGKSYEGRGRYTQLVGYLVFTSSLLNISKHAVDMELHMKIQTEMIRTFSVSVQNFSDPHTFSISLAVSPRAPK